MWLHQLKCVECFTDNAQRCSCSFVTHCTERIWVEHYTQPHKDVVSCSAFQCASAHRGQRLVKVQYAIRHFVVVWQKEIWAWRPVKNCICSMLCANLYNKNGTIRNLEYIENLEAPLIFLARAKLLRNILIFREIPPTPQPTRRAKKREKETNANACACFFNFIAHWYLQLIAICWMQNQLSTILNQCKSHFRIIGSIMNATCKGREKDLGWRKEQNPSTNWAVFSPLIPCIFIIWKILTLIFHCRSIRRTPKCITWCFLFIHPFFPCTGILAGYVSQLGFHPTIFPLKDHRIKSPKLSDWQLWGKGLESAFPKASNSLANFILIIESGSIPIHNSWTLWGWLGRKAFPYS